LPEISHPVSTKTSNLYATAVGKGRPLLFIHGFGANSYTWSKISGPLRENYRLILLDLKGHGRAPKPKDGAYSLHDQAELVTSFIIDNKLEDLTIVGHSLGGGVALLVTLKLASKIPNPISSLILIDSVAYSQALPGFIRILRIPVLAELLVWLVPNRLQTLQVLKRAYYDSTKITDETLEAYSRPLSLPGAHQALIESAKQIIPEDIEEIRRRYQTSASRLCLSGENTIES
jgi:pimeloyl-ACP methyl ester carboxylesterase